MAIRLPSLASASSMATETGPDGELGRTWQLACSWFQKHLSPRSPITANAQVYSSTLSAQLPSGAVTASGVTPFNRSQECVMAVKGVAKVGV